jgi:hypothetical protein
VHQFALVVFDSGDVWPLEVVQDTACIDEEFGFVVDHIIGSQIADFELPDGFRGIPLCMLDLVLELHVLVDEVVLLIDAFEVFEDLWGV